MASPTKYQEVVTATNYALTAEDGTPFPVFLRFDGTDDSMATGNIDFTGTDKMSVFAGYSLGPASLYANIVNLGNGLQGNVPGGFWFFNTDVNDLNITAQGTGISGVYAGYGSNPSKPVPANAHQVFSATLSTVGASYANIVPYKKNNPNEPNWTPSGAGVPGSGTFGNLPLYIGRIFSRTLSGRIYSLVVVGKLASAAEIASTENWVNQKTRAY